MRGFVLLSVIVGVVGCKAKSDYPLLHHADGGVDAPADATATPAVDGGLCDAQITCAVTVLCDANRRVETVALCDDPADPGNADARQREARLKVADRVVCRGTLTLVATCTASATSYTCPSGIGLEDATLCISGMGYDVDTADVCANLPPNQGACSVACDRDALYGFTTTGKTYTSPCQSTDGVDFQVIAAPKTGDGAR